MRVHTFHGGGVGLEPVSYTQNDKMIINVEWTGFGKTNGLF